MGFGLSMATCILCRPSGSITCKIPKVIGSRLLCTDLPIKVELISSASLAGSGCVAGAGSLLCTRFMRCQRSAVEGRSLRPSSHLIQDISLARSTASLKRFCCMVWASLLHHGDKGRVVTVEYGVEVPGGWRGQGVVDDGEIQGGAQIVGGPGGIDERIVVAVS